MYCIIVSNPIDFFFAWVNEDTFVKKGCDALIKILLYKIIIFM